MMPVAQPDLTFWEATFIYWISGFICVGAGIASGDFEWLIITMLPVVVFFGRILSFWAWRAAKEDFENDARRSKTSS